MDAAATAGGVIGGLLAVGLAGGLLFFFIRRRKKALAQTQQKMASQDIELPPKEPKRIETLEQQQQNKDEQQRKLELERAAQEQKKKEEEQRKEAALAAEQRRPEEMARSLKVQQQEMSQRQNSFAEETKTEELLFGTYKRTSTVSGTSRRSTIYSSGESRIAFVTDDYNIATCLKIGQESRLRKEWETYQHFKRFSGSASYIAEVLGDLKGPDEAGQFCISMAVGKVNLREYISKGPPLSTNQKLELCHQIILISNFISTSHVVWGDIKPENFVLFEEHNRPVWKAIDFDSAKILRMNKMWSPEDQITECYVCPERWRACKNKESIHAEKSQDVFVVGLVLVFIWTGQDFFDLQGNWEAQLCSSAELSVDKKIPKNLEAELRENIVQILQGMLKKQPEQRDSLDVVLNRRLFTGALPSMMATKFDKVVLDHLVDLKQGQAEMKDSLQDLKETLSKTFNLIVSEAVKGNGSEVPRFVLMVPLENQHNKPGRIARLGKAWKQTLTNVGLKHFFKMIIVDETQQLLTEHGISPSPDLAADGEPMHEGYDLVLPGETLGKIAPFLHVLSGAITVAGTVAKIAGFNIPAGIKEEVLALKELGEEMENFHEIWGDSGLGSVKDKLDTITAGIETHQDLAPLRTGTEIVYGPFFEQVERVLYGKTSQADSNSPFLSDIKAGKIVKLKNLSRGTTHFVGRRNFQLYFNSRRDLFAASEFNYKSA